MLLLAQGVNRNKETGRIDIVKAITFLAVSL